MNIHPTALVEEGVQIGEGTIVREFAIIRAGAKIGKNCIIAEFCLIEGAKIGNGTKIWDHSKVRKGAIVGENCNIGAKVNIDVNVKIGNNCKIQNSVNMFDGLTLEDGIFVGPNVQFTNALKPAAINPDGSKRTDTDWSPTKTLVKKGARICTNATVVCGITLGEWCFILPHACIRNNVGMYEMWGGLPAKHIGHMCHCGERTITIEDIEERIVDGYNSRKWFMPYCKNCKQFLPEVCSFWQKG